MDPGETDTLVESNTRGDSDTCECPPKRIKLSPKYDKDSISDYLDKDFKFRREMYVDHLCELFYLEQQGNLMDYYSWRKKQATIQLLQYLKSVARDDKDFEHLQIIKLSLDSLPPGSSKAPPIMTVTELEAAAAKLVISHQASSLSSQPITSRPTSTSSFVGTTKSPASSPASQMLLASPPSSTPATASSTAQSSSIGNEVTSAINSQSNLPFTTTTPTISTSSLTPSTPVTDEPRALERRSAKAQLQNASTVSKQASLTINSLSTPVNRSSTSIPTHTPVPISSTATPTMTTRKQSNKQHSLSSVYDMSIGSQEQIVERAKQEAFVMQRIAELRKEGLWSAKRLPKVQEPPRAKAHWDYLLEEMTWLATDFAQERKWKKTAAKKCARMVMKYHQDKEMQAEKAEKEELLKLKRIATAISKEIRTFWTNVEKLVEYRQQTRLEEKRKKALDLHLNYIVDQTEKFSSWLAAGMTKGQADNGVETQLNESNKQPCVLAHNLKSDCQTVRDSDDVDFEPKKFSESDDEETIAKDEEEYGTEGNKDELDLLKKESNMPLEELMSSYPSEAVYDSSVAASDDHDETNELVTDKISDDKDPTSQDDEFTVHSEEEDDEETITEQEKAEKNVDYASELKELEEDANVPVEVLLEKYRTVLEETCPDALTDNENTDSNSQSSDETTKAEVSDDDTEQDEELLTGDESESEELGMASLVDEEPDKKNFNQKVSTF